MTNDKSMLPIGTVLNGRYIIRGHLSSGGFGKTYLAVCRPHNTKVAIKEFFMTAANFRDADGVSVSTNGNYTQQFGEQIVKFRKEYERLRLISNVHVVKVYDCFEENGTAYYVMDFVEGTNLEEYLGKRNAPYTETTVYNYLKQILGGLKAIHSKDLLHLDLKPANIMKTPNGYVKLIDLGASKDYIGGVGATMFTGVARTERYAPPEQVDGSFDKLGPWSDFYALGATLYRLLTNRGVPTYTSLYEDHTRDKHIALPMPNVSDKTKLLIVWLMNTDRTRRPQSVDDILQWLRNPPAQDQEVTIHDPEVTINVPGEEKRPQQPPTPQPRPTPQPPTPVSQNDKFSLLGCFYMIIMIVIGYIVGTIIIKALL